MDGRTREYLRGRFGDHYRRHEPELPPAATDREWGYIPFSSGGTTMVRHRSLFDLGAIGEFLTDERPRHVYFSAGRYETPDARSMDAKGWQGADLIFDLDADHLPDVDPTTDGHARMLAACKAALQRLLDLLEADFGVDDPTIVFSGNRGYHVHVRDARWRGLDRTARREIVDYLLGETIEYEDVQHRVQRGPATRRMLVTDGGWGRRTHRRLLALLEELRAEPAETARKRLREIDGIGETRAERIMTAATEQFDQIRAGDVEVGGPGMRRLAQRCFERTVADERAPIDEPVTTDVNRLIRLPGSLHGGSGLLVSRIEREAVASFDPLSDAVPETFRDNRIRIELPEAREFVFDGEKRNIDAGITTVRESVGVFLMARGEATKAPEPG